MHSRESHDSVMAKGFRWLTRSELDNEIRLCYYCGKKVYLPNPNEINIVLCLECSQKREKLKRVTNYSRRAASRVTVGDLGSITKGKVE